MIQVFEDTIWKIICSLALLVWTILSGMIGGWIAGRWFRGMKITGRWDGINDEEGYVYDFKAYLFLERSEHDEAEREVNGFIVWKLVAAKKEFPKPIDSRGYEIVQGTLTRGKGGDKGTLLVLRHLGTNDRRLIASSIYNIFLTEKQTSCEGTTTDTNSGRHNGDLHGSVKGRF
jgi:hypothetical protein